MYKGQRPTGAAAEAFKTRQDDERAAFYANQTARLDAMDAEGQELNKRIAQHDAEIPL